MPVAVCTAYTCNPVFVYVYAFTCVRGNRTPLLTVCMYMCVMTIQWRAYYLDLSGQRNCV